MYLCHYILLINEGWIMKAFDKIIEIVDRLNAPDGCPWDIKQTFKTLRPYIIEEAHEVLEAIDEESAVMLQEELGDLFYMVIFYCKVAEREKSFTTDSMIQSVMEKLIRRHPHVFSDIKVEGEDEVVSNWERIKRIEKSDRNSVLDGIPKTLDIIFRAYKVITIMRRQSFDLPYAKTRKLYEEEEIGEKLLNLIHDSEMLGIDPEAALRKTLTKYEKAFRTWEAESNLSK